VKSNNQNDYVIRVLGSPLEIDGAAWDTLLAADTGSAHSDVSPFMRHAYLAALHSSGSASPESGWTPAFVTLWRGDVLVGACPLYLKTHSYGEYVFDWAWANAYAQHGIDYYPKALIAVPFTPVPGSRLLASTAVERVLLLRAVVAWCEAQSLSSLHLLFASDPDVDACREAGLMLRHTVQFHWSNAAPIQGEPQGALSAPRGYRDFDHFLSSLTQEKRKKIRQERRKVAEQGVSFRWARGSDITDRDWEFFYRCYERTYLEHGNSPYLSRDFFGRMQQTMPENWLLFTAERSGMPIATSLIALSAQSAIASATNDTKFTPPTGAAYGRYWGALERVDCLHFEACYYQPIEWCIAHGVMRFEGGAQGEHKMARALLPVATTSAHWLARPDFSDAVERFLAREGEGIANYMEHLEARSPLRQF
jgi:predicted N-acyltransferase